MLTPVHHSGLAPGRKLPGAFSRFGLTACKRTLRFSPVSESPTERPKAMRTFNTTSYGRKVTFILNRGEVNVYVGSPSGDVNLIAMDSDEFAARREGIAGHNGYESVSVPLFAVMQAQAAFGMTTP